MDRQIYKKAVAILLGTAVILGNSAGVLAAATPALKNQPGLYLASLQQDTTTSQSQTDGVPPVDSGESAAPETEKVDPYFPVSKPDETTSANPEQQPPKEGVINIYTLDDLALIGADDAHPMDGRYALMNDICGGTLAPIGTEKKPFTGVFDGNDHIIAKVSISSGDLAGFFGVLSGEVKNLTLLDLSVSCDPAAQNTTAGLLAGKLSGATVKNVMATGEVSAKLGGAVCGMQENSKMESVTYHTKTSMPAVGQGKADGALVLRSQPPYVAIVQTQTAKLQADEKLGPLTFSHYEYDPEITLQGEGRSISLTVSSTGRFSFRAVYQCTVQDQLITMAIDIPVIVGQDRAGLEELSTIDGVFYTQLGDFEVVQISALAPLELLSGVFTQDLTKETQQLISDDEKIINLITTWEQFKNIGNTQYDPNYTMNAIYLLNANITSDGTPFVPIGTEENPFTGEFDGRTFYIDVKSNPEIDSTKPYSGLFGVVTQPKQDTTSQENGGDSDAAAQE